MAGWKPEKIRAELVLHGKKQIDIARSLGVSPTIVGSVIKNTRTSRRVRREIAKAVNSTVNEIWAIF